MAGFTQAQTMVVFPCPILTGCICKVENLYLSALSHLSLGGGCFSFHRWSNCLNSGFPAQWFTFSGLWNPGYSKQSWYLLVSLLWTNLSLSLLKWSIQRGTQCRCDPALTEGMLESCWAVSRIQTFPQLALSSICAKSIRHPIRHLSISGWDRVLPLCFCVCKFVWRKLLETMADSGAPLRRAGCD